MIVFLIKLKGRILKIKNHIISYQSSYLYKYTEFNIIIKEYYIIQHLNIKYYVNIIIYNIIIPCLKFRTTFGRCESATY